MRTTIIIDRELWKKFRIHCVRKDTTASNRLKELIEKEIKV
jgi:hypothetical protein